MARLTITLDDQLHQALKESAARQGRSIGKIIEESLVLRGIKPIASAYELVAKARSNAMLREEDALQVAEEETRNYRQSR
jgi:plasmid stability protein